MCQSAGVPKIVVKIIALRTRGSLKDQGEDSMGENKLAYSGPSGRAPRGQWEPLGPPFAGSEAILSHSHASRE